MTNSYYISQIYVGYITTGNSSGLTKDQVSMFTDWCWQKGINPENGYFLVDGEFDTNSDYTTFCTITGQYSQCVSITYVESNDGVIDLFDDVLEEITPEDSDFIELFNDDEPTTSEIDFIELFNDEEIGQTSYITSIADTQGLTKTVEFIELFSDDELADTVEMTFIEIFGGKKSDSVWAKEIPD